MGDTDFRELVVENMVEGADMVIPRASVEEVNSRFGNTLYGFFLGNRLDFPVVEHYVKNTWGKFGLCKVMMNNLGYFFFQFASKEVLDQVMQRGPSLIRSVPILLNVWSPNLKLAKKEISSVPVLIKMHDVPLAAFTEDGLSMVATKVGKPILLDSYTSSMCVDSWGRHSFARAMVQVEAETELHKEVVVAIPNLNEDGYLMEAVKIEYEWKPPRCSTCKVFGHSDVRCPNHVVEVKDKHQMDDKEDGFIKVVHKKGQGKQTQDGPNGRLVAGIQLTMPKPHLIYRPKQKVDKAKAPEVVSNVASTSKVDVKTPSPKRVNNVTIQNVFSVLGDGVDEYGFDVGSHNQGRQGWL